MINPIPAAHGKAFAMPENTILTDQPLDALIRLMKCHGYRPAAIVQYLSDCALGGSTSPLGPVAHIEQTDAVECIYTVTLAADYHFETVEALFCCEWVNYPIPGSDAECSVCHSTFTVS